MTTKSSPTYRVQIFTSGPLNEVEQCCRKFCLRVGLCVTVEPVKFIYTGGEEMGAMVGLLNYPRFPSSKASLWKTAEALADAILDHACQHSVLITDSRKTVWKSKRKDSVK